MGPQRDGVGLWWTVTGRGKRSVALDLKSEDGRAAVWTLATQWADVIVENFRPGVLERMGLDWDSLHAASPSVILVRISGFGQFGPYSSRRGFGKIAEGFSGATNLTGARDAAPIQPGFSLGDATTATFGVIGALMALFSRERGGRGQVVDLALYEGLLRLIEWQLPLAAHSDVEVRRNGNAFPFEDAFITDIVNCANGESIIYSAATAAHLARLRKFLIGIGTAKPLESSADVVGVVREWAATVSSEAALAAFTEADLVAGPVVTPKQLLADPHLRARENIVELTHPELGGVVMPGIVPRLSDTPGRLGLPAPRLGEHTRRVLTDLVGLTPDKIEEMIADGVAEDGAHMIRSASNG
jgi:crotonobetainyl-CoA:carnitine CoA-transferase CaiB-like acyl-CoA transferase